MSPAVLRDSGHERLISNGESRLLSKEKQTMIDLRGISTNWLKTRAPIFNFKEPKYRFQGIDAFRCSLAGRYDNPIPTRFLAHIDCLKIPAQLCPSTRHSVRGLQRDVSWLTNSALLYSKFTGAQINLGAPTPYLTYAFSAKNSYKLV
jgi:hypothetical protein